MFGWTPEKILEMPAVRFMAILESGKRINEAKLNLQYLNLCDVASIPMGDAKYYEEVRKRFYYKAIGREDKLKGDRVMDADSPMTGMAVEAIFNQRIQVS